MEICFFSYIYEQLFIKELENIKYFYSFLEATYDIYKGK